MLLIGGHHDGGWAPTSAPHLILPIARENDFQYPTIIETETYRRVKFAHGEHKWWEGWAWIHESISDAELRECSDRGGLVDQIVCRIGGPKCGWCKTKTEHPYFSGRKSEEISPPVNRG